MLTLELNGRAVEVEFELGSEPEDCYFVSGRFYDSDIELFEDELEELNDRYYLVLMDIWQERQRSFSEAVEAQEVDVDFAGGEYEFA